MSANERRERELSLISFSKNCNSFVQDKVEKVSKSAGQASYHFKDPTNVETRNEIKELLSG